TDERAPSERLQYLRRKRGPPWRLDGRHRDAVTAERFQDHAGRQAGARPTVIGNPRRMLRAMPSRRPDGDCAATVPPTAIGTSSATASQIFRARAGGTEPDSGTNAKTKRAALGAAMPTSRSGHAAAAAVIPHRNSCRVPVTRPKRLTTAQSS